MSSSNAVLYLPVGNPKTKYLSGPGLKSFILFATYLAAHSETLSALSIIISLIVTTTIITLCNRVTCTTSNTFHRVKYLNSIIRDY